MATFATTVSCLPETHRVYANSCTEIVPREGSHRFSPLQDTSIYRNILACHISARIGSKEYASSSDVVWLGHCAVHDLALPAF
jgi:hypothetical protein